MGSTLGLTRKRLAGLVALSVFLLCCVVAGSTGLLSVDALLAREAGVRQWVENHGVIAFASGLAVYIIASLIPGTTGKAILFGWLFGFWQGLVIVSTALTAAATISFLLARFVFYDWLREARFKRLIGKMDHAFERDGGFYLVTLRLLHVPYTLVNYSAGATSVTTWTFIWTTWLGMLPGNAAFVLAGSQLPTASEIVERGIWSIVDLRVLAGLSIAAVLPLVARRGSRLVRRRLRSRRGATREGLDTVDLGGEQAGET